MLMKRMVCARIFFFYYHLPSFKTRFLTRILDLNGFDGREYGKDSLTIFCLTTKQTTKCCKKTSCLNSHTHMYTTQCRNTQEDSCRLNGWQPTETKYVLTRKWRTQECKFLLFTIQVKEMDSETTQRSHFPPHKYNGSAGLAVHSLTLLKPRNNLHPVLHIFYSFGSSRYSLL